MRITSFRGEHHFLSNFYGSQIFYEGMLFPTVEHFYQASKTLDREARFKISNEPGPANAKSLGRQLVIRSDWDEVKLDIMFNGVTLKFLTWPELMQRLVDTGTAELIEGNQWGDRFWGATWDDRSHIWIGANNLGKILMDVRQLINRRRLT